MALLYRKDIFDEYGIEVPTTWDQFAQEAEKLHKANSETYLADFTPEDGGWLTGLMWQAGARPFEVDGTKVSISMDDPAIQKVSEYWGDLVDRGVVATDPGFTNDWYRSFAKGIYATWPTAAWGPVFLEGVAGESKGKWRAAPFRSGKKAPTIVQLGRLDAGRHHAERERRGGGPTRHVAHPRPQADRACTRPSSSSSRCSTTSWTALRSKNRKFDFYGGQAVNSVFVEASNNVDKGFEWSPFQDYVYAQMEEQFGAAATGDTEFSQVPVTLQRRSRATPSSRASKSASVRSGG